MKKQNTSLRAILKVWNKKRIDHPEIASLRKLAGKLKISHGYLSKILAGQKPLTAELAHKFVKALSPDPLSREIILRSFRKEPETEPTIVKQDLSVFELATSEAEWLLGKWYRTVLLDLMTLSNFESSSAWMARSLGISVQEVELSLQYLEKQELAYRDGNGDWKKKHELLRFPIQISKKVVREHYQSQMKRASDVLSEKTTPKDSQERFMASLSISCNPENFNSVKQALHQTIYEAALKLSQGECTEVYQINLQFFPQTNIKS